MPDYEHLAEGDRATLALPGDADLDLDYDGVTLTAVVAIGDELLAQLRGGFGEFDSDDGDRFVIRPGDDDTDTTLEISASFPDHAPHLFAALVAQLERWRDTATPLHLCAAPERLSTLIESRERWLPLPRSH